MSYKVSGTESIKDDQTVIFETITATVRRTLPPQAVLDYTFQGSTSGYTSGGQNPPSPAPPAGVNTIDKFPLSSDANATDVGDLSQTRTQLSGQSSAENGYTSGGWALPN